MNRHDKRNIVFNGVPLHKAKRAIIMLHGRGATADGIVSLKRLLDIEDFAIVAPQATNMTWYPNSFTAPVSSNQPWLDSALSLISEVIKDMIKNGISKENVHLLGFSQGACLSLEYAARNASRFGSVIAFCGALIGEKVSKSNYGRDLNSTPVFLGCGDNDPHIPLNRVDESAEILEEMSAKVHKLILNGIGHTITAEEIKYVNDNILDETTE